MKSVRLRTVSRPTFLQLALQGGGAHGAFTWGVLDRLLDEESIELGQVSGTSAGALNGAALVSGLARGGRAAAKEHLSRLWHGIATVGTPLAWLMTPLRKPGLGVWDDALPLLSPYMTNPLAMEPIRALLAGILDIDAINAAGPHSLYVNAVNVNTGRCRVFGPGEQSLQTILASACAPLVFQAVVIDGESYWDGGYAGNPSLWPLYAESSSVDLLLVELTPLTRAETPTTAKNILNRINEIASIQGLVAELQAVDLINRTVPGRNVRLHVVSLPDAGSPLQIEPSIKRTVALELFYALQQRGHAACDAWLASRTGNALPAPTDIEARYLQSGQPAVRRAA
jgi:NTE family protein